MMRALWDPVTSWNDLVTDRADGPAETYGEVLRTSPVAYVEREGAPGFWAIFGHAEVVSAVRDVGTFSSVVNPDDPPVIPLEVDPPRHAPYRRLLNPHFTAEAMAVHEDELRALAGRLLDEQLPARRYDFAAEFAGQFPIRALCRVLGVPDADWQKIYTLVTNPEVRQVADDPERSTRQAQIREMIEVVQPILDDRRANPGADVISKLLVSEIDGVPLTDGAVVGLFLSLVFGGQDTTRRAVSNIVLRLARDPELQSFLRSHPERIADAVEESLRLDSPQQAMPRRCVVDTEVAGQQIRAGEHVWLTFGAANVDPGQWTEPGKFDIDRANRRHLGLGRGLHQCIGLNLAKLEMRVAVEELLARTESFEAPEPVTRTDWPELGVTEMPLVVVPASR